MLLSKDGAGPTVKRKGVVAPATADKTTSIEIPTDSYISLIVRAKRQIALLKKKVLIALDS